MEEFIISTTENVPGYRVVKVLGVARGATVRAKHLGKDILAGLRIKKHRWWRGKGIYRNAC